MVEELGADPNVIDRWGGTPLDDATRHGHSEVAKYLEEHEAQKGTGRAS